MFCFLTGQGPATFTFYRALYGTDKNRGLEYILALIIGKLEKNGIGLYSKLVGLNP